MNRRNSRNEHGSALEKDLDRYHQTLPDWLVYRQYPEVRKVLKAWIPTGVGAPDYLAIHPSSGRAVLFDAKSVETEEWYVSGLADHQFAMLERHHRRGGISGVYLRARGRDAWVPWSVVGTLRAEYQRNRTATFLTVDDGFHVAGCDWPSVILNTSCGDSILSKS